MLIWYIYTNICARSTYISSAVWWKWVCHPIRFDIQTSPYLWRMFGATVVLYQHLVNVDPISLLPREVLENIFIFCTSWLHGYQKPKNCLAWSQVCRDWRHIALNSGRFWRHIDLSDTRFANEFLFRSKQAPLYITTILPLTRVPDFTNYGHRLQSLEVTLSVDIAIRFFVCVGRELPIMTRLSLSVIPMTTVLSLALTLPSLRQLSLESLAIGWGQCKNLTYLFLRGNHEANCPTLMDLHRILESSPKIEYVRLDSYAPSGGSVRLPPIPLPCLRDFIVSSHPLTIRSILSMICPGAYARLQFYVSFDDLRSLFPYRLPYRPDSKAEETPVHSAWPSDTNTVRLSRHGVYFIQNDTLPWCDDPSKIILSVSSACFINVHVCDSLHHVFDGNTVTSLELNIGVLENIPLGSLECLFRNMQQLRTLCTAFNDISMLCYILESIDKTTMLPYVPQLAKLSFSRRTDTWWYFGDLWMGSILQTIRSRNDHAVPIQTLEFYDCRDICPMMVKELQNTVERVAVIEKQGGNHFP